jgi:hypothetical protein
LIHSDRITVETLDRRGSKLLENYNVLLIE